MNRVIIGCQKKLGDYLKKSFQGFFYFYFFYQSAMMELLLNNHWTRTYLENSKSSADAKSQLLIFQNSFLFGKGLKI